MHIYHTQTHTHTYACASAHTYTHECVCVCVYVFVYVCARETNDLPCRYRRFRDRISAELVCNTLILNS